MVHVKKRETDFVETFWFNFFMDLEILAIHRSPINLMVLR